MKNRFRIKSLKTRIIIKILAILIVLFILIDLIFAFGFRQESLYEAKTRANTVAKTVRDSLTSLMVMGVINERALFIDRLQKTVKSVDISKIRIIRSGSVNKQFGPGFKNEIPATDNEEYVLSTGKVYENVSETLGSVSYRVIIPYKAQSTGAVDCLACHHVPSGTVLGAISLRMNLTGVRTATLRIVSWTSVIFLTFLIILVLLFFRFLNPYINLFRKIEISLEKIKEGDIDNSILNENNLPADEAGDVAKTLNQTAKDLKKILSDIESKVSSLIGYSVMKTENYLTDTIKIIGELVRIYNFKKVIEKDRTRNEILKRIEFIIKEYMAFDNYTIYEVKNNNKIGIFALGAKKNLLGENDMWCIKGIIEDADLCRAKRTGMDVDSADFHCICPSFAFCEDTHNYYCIPIYMRGQVGAVLNLVFDDDVADFVHMMVPYIKGYLSEASPVIESRVLNELLKEQSIIDTLTSLHNRRFLEEAADGIVAGINRRGSVLGVLMADIDLFKQVNDRYGHDNGDKVLSNVAKEIKKNIRESDIAVRFGGEEFLVLLMDIKEGEGIIIAEKIRKAVESLEVELSGGIVIKKTISIGVCEFPPDSSKFWQAVKYSDVALYNAKETGRNKSVRFKKEMWTDKEY